MSSSYDSSEEEFDIEEEEDLAMILAMHINKKLKHGGSVMGRQKIWRDRIDAHNRLIRHYFAENPTYPEPPCFGFLLMCTARIIARSSSSSISNSFSEESYDELVYNV